MVSLRDTPMNLFRLAGARSMAQATRHCAHQPAIAATLMGAVAA